MEALAARATARSRTGIDCRDANPGDSGYHLPVMWVIYAITASLCWGMSYAASGPILRSGFSPLVFFFGYSLLGMIGGCVALLVSGRFSEIWKLASTLPASHLGWFLFSLAGAALGAYLTYLAIGAKNPTLAAFIEISYPLFVLLFAWVFFREVQVNAMTLAGGLLVMGGVAVILAGQR